MKSLRLSNQLLLIVATFCCCAVVHGQVTNQQPDFHPVREAIDGMRSGDSSDLSIRFDDAGFTVQKASRTEIPSSVGNPCRIGQRFPEMRPAVIYKLTGSYLIDAPRQRSSPIAHPRCPHCILIRPRAAAPKMDFFSPNVYSPDFQGVCAQHDRPDNPFFPPKHLRLCPTSSGPLNTMPCWDILRLQSIACPMNAWLSLQGGRRIGAIDPH